MDLPPEIIYHICERMPAKDIVSLQSTCTDLNNYDVNKFWRYIWRNPKKIYNLSYKESSILRDNPELLAKYKIYNPDTNIKTIIRYLGISKSIIEPFLQYNMIKTLGIIINGDKKVLSMLLDYFENMEYKKNIIIAHKMKSRSMSMKYLSTELRSVFKPMYLEIQTAANKWEYTTIENIYYSKLSSAISALKEHISKKYIGKYVKMLLRNDIDSDSARKAVICLRNLGVNVDDLIIFTSEESFNRQCALLGIMI
jgi:hypothetical protein